MDFKFFFFKYKSKIILFYVIISFNSYFIFNSSFQKKILLINEIKEIEKYFKLCNKEILIEKRNFTNVSNPKISIISPVFNKEKYINRFLRSIENQYFDDIEIIFIDDKSNDKSVDKIKNSQNEDNRITLIQHKKSKGTLISRNQGALKSRGEYLLFVDPDDILTNGMNLLDLICMKEKEKLT